MRNIFLLFIVTFISLSLSAQLSLGINTSFNASLDKSSELILVERGYQRYGVDYKGAENHISYGMTAYAENEKLYFMPTINYTSVTNRLSAMDYVEGDNLMKDFTIETQSVHIPITAGVKLGKARIGVGPDFMYTLDMHENISSFSGLTLSERNFRTGFHFQLGYDPIPNVKLSMGYQVGFYKVSDDFRFAGKHIGLDSTPKSLSFTVGLFL